MLQLTVAAPIGTAFADSAFVAGEAPAVTLTARAADGTALALPDTLTVRWASSAAAVLGAPTGTRTSATLIAAGPGTAQLTASVALRQNGAAVAATASVTRAVRAESLTVFALAAPATVRTNRTAAVTLDTRGRRGTPVIPADLTLTSSAPGVVPAPNVPASATPAPGPLALSTTVGGAAGTATLTAQVMGRTATTAITVTAPPVPIELVFEADAPAALRAGFRAAAERWEDTFTGPLPAAGTQAVAANACGLGTPGVSGAVPGIKVFIFVKPDSTLPTAAAVAAPCGGGSTGWAYGARPVVLTIVGAVSVRSSVAGGTADGNGLPTVNGQPPVYLVNLGVHELGHVLGVGTQWNAGTRVDRSDSTDYRLHTPLAMQAFVAAGGTLAGAKANGVPLEMTAGRQGHWRTGVFVSAVASDPVEIMTATAVSTTVADRLSAITLGALTDLGYPVALSAADAFTLPTVAVSGPGTGPSGNRMASSSLGPVTGSVKGPVSRPVLGRMRPGDTRVVLGDDVGARR